MATHKHKDIKFDCPKCKGSLIVESKGIGLTVSCPICEDNIIIPEDGENGAEYVTENNVKTKLSNDELLKRAKQKNTNSSEEKKFHCISCSKSFLSKIDQDSYFVECTHCKTSFQFRNSSSNDFKTSNLPRTKLPNKKTSKSRSSLHNKPNHNNISPKYSSTNPYLEKPQPDYYNPYQKMYPMNMPNMEYGPVNPQDPNYYHGQMDYPGAKNFPMMPSKMAKSGKISPNEKNIIKPIPKNYPSNLPMGNIMGKPIPNQMPPGAYGADPITKARKRKFYFSLTLIVLMLAGVIFYLGFYNSRKKIKENQKLSRQKAQSFINEKEKSKNSNSSVSSQNDRNKNNDRNISVNYEEVFNDNKTVFEMLVEFFNTKDISVRASHVRQSIDYFGNILQYYKENPIVTKDVASYEIIKIHNVNKKIFAELEVRFSNHETNIVFVQYTPEDELFLIDWDSLHAYQNYSFDKFIENPTESKHFFRLNAKKEDYFKGFYKNKDDIYDCYKLIDPTNENKYVYGYIDKSSKAGVKLAKIFYQISKNEYKNVIVTLVFKKKVKDISQMEIKDLVSTNWLIP